MSATSSFWVSTIAVLPSIIFLSKSWVGVQYFTLSMKYCIIFEKMSLLWFICSIYHSIARIPRPLQGWGWIAQLGVLFFLIDLNAFFFILCLLEAVLGYDFLFSVLFFYCGVYKNCFVCEKFLGFWNIARNSSLESRIRTRDFSLELSQESYVWLSPHTAQIGLYLKFIWCW